MQREWQNQLIVTLLWVREIGWYNQAKLIDGVIKNVWLEARRAVVPNLRVIRYNVYILKDP